jgi:hypothetical protein
MTALNKITDLPGHHFSVRNPVDGDHVTMTRSLVDSLDFGFAILAHADEEQVRRDYAAIRAGEEELLIAG